MRLSDFSEADFRQMAVHYDGHPDHDKFLHVLKNPVFDEEIVKLTDVAAFR